MRSNSSRASAQGLVQKWCPVDRWRHRPLLAGAAVVEDPARLAPRRVGDRRKHGDRAPVVRPVKARRHGLEQALQRGMGFSRKSMAPMRGFNRGTMVARAAHHNHRHVEQACEPHSSKLTPSVSGIQMSSNTDQDVCGAARACAAFSASSTVALRRKGSLTKLVYTDFCRFNHCDPGP